jgi:hypothetical protein
LAAERLRATLTPLAALADRHELDEMAYPRIRSAIDDCLGDLQATGLWGRDNLLPSSELWNIAGEILLRGWLQNQARIKPRGYAGDYEMLARIYQSRLCDDPLGRHFDRYFQEQAAPQAVRNRMAMMADWIRQAVNNSDSAPLKIVIVGSAFGLEVRDGLAGLSAAARRRVSVVLLDLDPQALEFARIRLETLLPEGQLTLAAENLFRLPDRPRAASRLQGADLLFCAGMFDYLDDAAATDMLATFWQRLAPGGRMWVFQFAPQNPTRAYMEWLGNWYLVYRLESDLRTLAVAAGMPHAAIQCGAEPLGIDLFLTACKA